MKPECTSWLHLGLGGTENRQFFKFKIRRIRLVLKFRKIPCRALRMLALTTREY